MFSKLKKIIPDRHPLRLFYHRILAFVAVVVNGFPARHLHVIGVTGTNGKTTTVNMLVNILNTADYKVGMASTINFQVGDERWANISKQTTVGPFQLQKLLKSMVKDGCKYAVLEVTSHALDQSRVFGINFDIALFTNITQDHVEYHGGFNNYLSAKGKLFKFVSKGKRKFGIPKVLVLNEDDKYFNYFNRFSADRKITYGLKNSTVRAEDVVMKPSGSSFVLHVPNNSVPVNLPMPGKFNIYNALGASAIALVLQVPLATISKGLESGVLIKGRFEHVDCGQDYSVIVDYAHTPEALESLFELYRKLTSGKLFAVFGATGGGRDKGKRVRMGEAVAKHADYIIVTDDDPYDEDEWGIIKQVSEGVKRKEGDGFWMIPDRREAIRLALTQSHKGDTVVIAGKGAEEVMMFRGRRIEWNDKKVVEELLEREVSVYIDDGDWEERDNIRLSKET